MFFFLVVCILLAVVYLGYKVVSLQQHQASMAAFVETQLKEIGAAQQVPPTTMAYGWFDNGWPVAKEEKEDRAALENPMPYSRPDDYDTQMLVAEYMSMPTPHERKEFLRQMFKQGVWMEPGLLDAIYADENAHVRAWAAGHLETDFKDYTDHKNPREIRNYEPALLQDPEPIVRAALWSNPNCNRLPWNLVWSEIHEGWKDQMRNMSHIERLGLMRNPELLRHYVVALLETPSEELGMTRKEHGEVLSAAAVNPHLVGGSRRYGREAYTDGEYGNPPSEEYGKMWEFCLDKWIDQPPVPYLFVKYIQTTPEVKLATYNRLLEKADYKWLREEVIRTCDPFIDHKVLKMVWNDPDEGCRRIAAERVGRFTSYVGVKARKSG